MLGGLNTADRHPGREEPGRQGQHAGGVVANDEHAVGLHSVHAERDGKTLEDNNTLVFHVRDGKATEVWQYWADQYAADELFG